MSLRLAARASAEIELHADGAAEVAHVDEIEIVGRHAERLDVVRRHQRGGGIVPVGEPGRLEDYRIAFAVAELNAHSAAQIDYRASVQSRGLEPHGAGAERDEGEDGAAADIELELAAETAKVERARGKPAKERRRRLVVAGQIPELRFRIRAEQIETVELDEFAESESELPAVEERALERGVVREANSLADGSERVTDSRHLRAGGAGGEDRGKGEPRGEQKDAPATFT